MNYPAFKKDITLSIIQICLLCIITGLTSLVFVLEANKRFKTGEVKEFEYNRRISKMVQIVGWIFIGLYIIVLAVIFTHL